MHPERVRRGLHAVARALADAAEIDTPLGSGDRIGDVRYTFADSVAIAWLPDEAEPQIDVLRDRIMDIAWFAQRAVSSYFLSRLKLAEDAGTDDRHRSATNGSQYDS
jgi:hypothetical protein